MMKITSDAGKKVVGKPFSWRKSKEGTRRIKHKEMAQRKIKAWNVLQTSRSLVFLKYRNKQNEGSYSGAHVLSKNTLRIIMKLLVIWGMERTACCFSNLEDT